MIGTTLFGSPEATASENPGKQGVFACVRRRFRRPHPKHGVVDDRGAMASMDLQVIADPAAQADQTAGVEDGDEFGIAGVLVHEFRDGKVHDYAP